MMDLKTHFHQPTLGALELKKGKGTDYFFSWKSKRVFNSQLKPLYAAFLDSIKTFGYRICIKLNKGPLAAERSN